MRPAGALVAVCAAGLLAHGPALGAGFVYDDHRFILHNEAIRSVAPGDFLRDAATASDPEGVTVDVYRPARTLLYALQWQAFGAAPAGWHAVSIGLHLLAAGLLWRLLIGLLPGAPGAVALAAALYAVHPKTSEVVAWVSSQGDLLAQGLSLAALLLLVRPGAAPALLGLGAFALACLAKESALMLPAWVWLLARICPRGAGHGRALALRLGGMGLVLAGYFALRLSVVPSLAQVGHPEGSALATARGMLAGLVFYARGLVDPRPFTFDLRFDVPLSWAEPEVVFGAGLLASLLLAAGWALVTRRGLLLLATLGVLAALVPVSNVLVPLKTFVADRFFYPALVPVAVGLAAALAAVPRPRRGLALGAAAALGAAFVPASVRNARAWHDDLSLWTAVRDDRPDNPTAWYGIARAQRERRHLAEAERGYRTYLEFNPIDGKAAYELGDLFDEVAGGLYIADARVRDETDVEFRRRQARVAQIEAYRRAYDVWAHVGFEAGRGSAALRRAMLERWANAALDLPDLGEARFAVDALLADLGLDPRDARRVMAEAPWHHRRIRWVMAWVALRHRRGDLAPAARAAVARLGADLLRDVGLDPGEVEGQLLPRFERAFRDLIAEREASGRAAEPMLRVCWAQALAAQGRTREARDLLEAALRRAPGDPVLRDGLAGLGPEEGR